MKSEKIFSGACLSILLLFFLSIVAVVFTRFILVERFGIDNSATRIVLSSMSGPNDAQNPHFPKVSIWWEELYPFVESRSNVKGAPKSPGTNVGSSISKIIEYVKNGVTFYATDHLVGYKKIAQSARAYESAIQWNYASSSGYNGVVRGFDGEIIPIGSYSRTLKEDADEVRSLAEFCQARDIPFLYINIPNKSCKFVDADVSGVIDYSNQNADQFLDYLSSWGVENYDLRTYLHDEGLDHHKLFYKMDTHWTTPTAIWATRKIASILNEKHGFSFDLNLLDDKNLKSTIYPKCFVGSFGRKLLFNVTPDDFILTSPKYKTDFHYEVKSLEIDADGDFSILYDADVTPPEYIYGVQALETVQNKLIENQSRVLLVHDSFGNYLVPFLALGLRQVDSIDLRGFTGSVKSYVQEERPDLVIVIYTQTKYSGSDRPYLFKF